MHFISLCTITPRSLSQNCPSGSDTENAVSVMWQHHVTASLQFSAALSTHAQIRIFAVTPAADRTTAAAFLATPYPYTNDIFPIWCSEACVKPQPSRARHDVQDEAVIFFGPNRDGVASVERQCARLDFVTPDRHAATMILDIFWINFRSSEFSRSSALPIWDSINCLCLLARLQSHDFPLCRPNSLLRKKRRWSWVHCEEQKWGCACRNEPLSR